MKKTIYSAVLGALLATSATQALALDMSFDGVIREYIETDRVTGSGSNSTTSKEEDRDPGIKLTNFISRFGMHLVEPLNDVSPGLKFKSSIVTDFYADSPTVGTTNPGPSNRSIMIGNNRATAGFGNDMFDIEFGRKAHLVWLSHAKYGSSKIGAVSDQQGTILGEIHARQKLRLNNGIYGSVKLGGGFTAMADYSLSEKGNVDDPYAVGLNWQGNGFDVQYVHFDVRDGIAKTELLAGAYTFENKARVSFIYSDDKYNVGNPDNTTLARNHTKGYSVAAQYPMTQKWWLDLGAGRRDDGVDAASLGFRYLASRSITLVSHLSVTKSDNPIYMTTPNDFAGVYGTDRVNAGVGLQVAF
jgi:predicted porin